MKLSEGHLDLIGLLLAALTNAPSCPAYSKP
jgi:hypothetical protein